ncbi:hypothetical protein DPEC_G00225020 [Dallia pectoralis]|uniref:Uncharacterized protein n=1 Tax=Dallia pectoralis TaxID=75939 RepID=A0ACC2G0C6_DALPE|nr:hypothetical protein DPEC_G00225020 [Dallia pectoralis]
MKFEDLKTIAMPHFSLGVPVKSRSRLCLYSTEAVLKIQTIDRSRGGLQLAESGRLSAGACNYTKEINHFKQMCRAETRPEQIKVDKRVKMNAVEHQPRRPCQSHSRNQRKSSLLALNALSYIDIDGWILHSSERNPLSSHLSLVRHHGHYLG